MFMTFLTCSSFLGWGLVLCKDPITDGVKIWEVRINKLTGSPHFAVGVTTNKINFTGFVGSFKYGTLHHLVAFLSF